MPWQYVAGRTGAAFRAIPIDEHGELQLDALDEIEREGTVKVVANNLVSNTLGTINPVEKLAAWAHERGAIMVVDAAQAAPHRTLDVQALGCDFLAISSHKMCGPSGAGALWGRRELLEQMSPFNLGGEMIRSVSISTRRPGTSCRTSSRPARPRSPRRSASALLSTTSPRSGSTRSSATSTSSSSSLSAGSVSCPGSTCTGLRAERRAGIVSFNVQGVHPHDVAQVLDWEGVAVRAGHHCTQPLMTKLGVAATTRASFYLYSIPDEIDRLVDGLHKAKSSLG